MILSIILSNNSENYELVQFLVVVVPTLMWLISCFMRMWARKNGKKWRTAPPKNCRPTVARLLVDCWPTVGWQLADCRLPPFAKIFCQQSADCWPFVGQLSADCWQHVSNVSAKCRLRMPVEYQKSLCSQGGTLHINAKWNFFTWVIINT